MDTSVVSNKPLVRQKFAKSTSEIRQAMYWLNATFLPKMMDNSCLEYHIYWFRYSLSFEWAFLILTFFIITWVGKISRTYSFLCSARLLILTKSHLKLFQTVGAEIVLLKDFTNSNKFDEIRLNLLCNTSASFILILFSFSSRNKSVNQVLRIISSE